MTRTIAILVCALLTRVLVVSPLPGRFTCHSFSEPLFRTSSISSYPLFLDFKPFLNVFPVDPPAKPQTDAIFTPEPTEADISSPILHKTHRVTENCEEYKDAEKEQEQEDEVKPVAESIEEDLPLDIDYQEVTYYNNSEEEDGEDLQDTSDLGECDENCSDGDDEVSDGHNSSDRGPVLFP